MPRDNWKGILCGRGAFARREGAALGGFAGGAVRLTRRGRVNVKVGSLMPDSKAAARAIEASEIEIATHWKEGEYLKPSERFAVQGNLTDSVADSLSGVDLHTVTAGGLPGGMARNSVWMSGWSPSSVSWCGVARSGEPLLPIDDAGYHPRGRALPGQLPPDADRHERDIRSARPPVWNSASPASPGPRPQRPCRENDRVDDERSGSDMTWDPCCGSLPGPSPLRRPHPPCGEPAMHNE
jgi:hypothetical protein